jgi:S-adenosylmethionine synthetase
MSSLPAWPSAVEVQVAYAIGVARPLSINIETFGTGKIPMMKSPAWLMKTLTCARVRSSAT